MAIPHFSVAIIGRSGGRSAVDAAAYASRTDLEDERLGKTYRYGRKAGDVVMSRIMLPKGAPERLRDRAALWNEAEKAETRINSRTARRIIVALPHELTAKQQEQLLTDFVRENFTRKGLAVDMNIHGPDPQGDQRNDHAHLIVTTRMIGKDGIGGKVREMDDKATLQSWRDSWEKMVNHQLERYGHAVRISMKSLEEQGIDRTPQIHMGQAATALSRKGVETDRRDQLESVANDNQRTVGSEFKRAARQTAVQQPQEWTAGKAFAREVITPPANDDIRPQDRAPETIDRDRQDAEWQDTVDKAAIAYADEQRRELMQAQDGARATFERHAQEMAARHHSAWHEVAQRYKTATSSYQPGTVTEAEQAVTGGLSFFLSLFTSWAESITRSVTGTRPRPGRRTSQDKAKDREAERQQEQQKQQRALEMEALQQEQARERAEFERRRALMLYQQATALAQFEQQVSEKSSLQTEFRVQRDYEQSRREAAATWDKQRIVPSGQGKDKDASRDGPELG